MSVELAVVWNLELFSACPHDLMKQNSMTLELDQKIMAHGNSPVSLQYKDALKFQQNRSLIKNCLYYL